MRVIWQSYEVLGFDVAHEVGEIEQAGRTSYLSERKDADSALRFAERRCKEKHYPVLEFGDLTVRFITDRGVTHELVRHRHASFVQESTRYCNYSKERFGSEITVIHPEGFGKDLAPEAWAVWMKAMQDAEKAYFACTHLAVAPEVARGVLPMSLKAVIVMKANFVEWRHVFQLRAIEKGAHPQMRALMIPLYEEMRTRLPEVFDMGDPK